MVLFQTTGLGSVGSEGLKGSQNNRLNTQVLYQCQGHILWMVNMKKSWYYYQFAAFHKTENEVLVPQYLPKLDAE